MKGEPAELQAAIEQTNKNGGMVTPEIASHLREPLRSLLQANFKAQDAEALKLTAAYFNSDIEKKPTHRHISHPEPDKPMSREDTSSALTTEVLSLGSADQSAVDGAQQTGSDGRLYRVDTSASKASKQASKQSAPANKTDDGAEDTRKALEKGRLTLSSTDTDTAGRNGRVQRGSVEGLTARCSA